MDATKAQQQEELNEILRKARTNPWHLFKSGLLRRVDETGMRMETPDGDPLVRITPFHSLPSNLKSVLGDEFTWASWLQYPLSGYGLHFFLKAFELGKLTGNYLVEFQRKPKVYSNGYRPPYEKYEQRFPGGLAAMLKELTEAEKMEFRTLASVVHFLMMLGRANQRLTRLTTPRNSRRTTLSSWKGMCTVRSSTSVTTSRFLPLSLLRRTD